MGSFKIINPGLLSSFQDMGRSGYAFYSIPTSGCLDKQSAAYANIILKKPIDAPVIECNIIAPQIQFLSTTQIVITGADFNWQLNGNAIRIGELINIKTSDILKGKSSREGCRGYLAINGDLKLDKVYDSYSTYLMGNFGGYQGRQLKKGDVVEWNELNPIVSDIQMDIHFKKDNQVNFFKGPEFDWLSSASKEILFSSAYTVQADSNRMGTRLKGPALQLDITKMKGSVPVLPGFIQLTPDGQPIVLLNDAQVTGGYPRIGYIPEAALPAFCQTPIGSTLNFKLG